MITPARNVTDYRIKALPKQLDFVKSLCREVLYSGAFGAGKSRALCMKLVCRAAIYGTREGLCRKNLVNLKATTMRTLLDSDGELPAVLPAGSYTWHKTDKIIRINGGGEIVYFGLDDPSKIGSYNLTGCGIDQAEELTEDDWVMLRGRCRMNLPNVTRQMYGVCNPGQPSHHLATRFGLAGGYKAQPDCEAIRTKTTDNIFLPEDYVRDMLSLTGLARRRYVDGLWCGSEGLVYDRWDRQVFVQTKNIKHAKQVIVGVDEGYTNPAVMLICGIDGDDNVHVHREWYKTRQLESDVIERAQHLKKTYNVSMFVVDPSAAKLRASMQAADLPVIDANNDVFGGIQAVQRRLVLADNGVPRLSVDPGCEQAIREFEAYEWLEGKDKPNKEFDHAMDALRYAVMYADAGGRLGARLMGLSMADTNNAERMWR
jgi:PBSX family phage terminase large subunit